jgi:hypothetical protein
VFFYARHYDDLRSIDGMSLMVYRTLHVLCSFFLCLSLSFVVFKPHAPVMGNTLEKAGARLSRLSLFLEMSTLALVLVPLVPTTFVSAPIFLDLFPSVAQSQVRMHANLTRVSELTLRPQSVASLMTILRLVPEVSLDFKRSFSVFAPADLVELATHETLGTEAVILEEV